MSFSLYRRIRYVHIPPTVLFNRHSRLASRRVASRRVTSRLARSPTPSNSCTQRSSLHHPAAILLCDFFATSSEKIQRLIVSIAQTLLCHRIVSRLNSYTHHHCLYYFYLFVYQRALKQRAGVATAAAIDGDFCPNLSSDPLAIADDIFSPPKAKEELKTSSDIAIAAGFLANGIGNRGICEGRLVGCRQIWASARSRFSNSRSECERTIFSARGRRDQVIV